MLNHANTSPPATPPSDCCSLQGAASPYVASGILWHNDTDKNISQATVKPYPTVSAWPTSLKQEEHGEVKQEVKIVIIFKQTTCTTLKRSL